MSGSMGNVSKMVALSVRVVGEKGEREGGREVDSTFIKKEIFPNPGATLHS